MKYKYIIYLTDEIIYVKNKKTNDIIKFKLSKDVIKYGKVYNITKFLDAFNKLINTNHLNNNLFGDKIKVIVNANYSPADIYFLKSLLEKFNYRKITFEKETKLYKLNKSNAYLNIFNNYLMLSYIDEYKKINNYIIPANFFNSTKDLFRFVKNKIEERDLFLIGNGNLIEEFMLNFEAKNHNKTYLHTDSEIYLLNSVY